MQRSFSIKIIIFIFITCVSLFGNNFYDVSLTENKKIVDDFTISYLKSKESLNIGQVSQMNFENNTSNNFSLGYNPSTLWMKITLKNNTNNSDFILTVNEHFYEKFNLYYFDNGWKKKENGLFMPLESREIKTNKLSFKINLQKNQIRTYFLELKGKYAYFGKIIIYQDDEFYIKEQINTNSFFSFIFGIFSLVLFFSLFLFIKLKERIYLFYFLYGVFYLIYVVNISGILSYFSLHNYVYILHSSGAFTIVFFSLFSIEYLNTKKYLKYFTKIILFLVSVLIICGILSMFNYTPWNKVVNNTVGVITLLWIFSSLILYFKGYTYVKFYVLIIVVYSIFIILFTLMVSGKVDYNLITRYGYIIASTLELVFFTLLLVNKYTVAYIKQINNQKVMIDLKNNQEKVLKLEVKKRTLELEKSNSKLQFLVHERELLLKEIFHRVKNNFHMIIGILWFEAEKSEDKKLFIELINRIKSMSKLHEHLLYSSRSIEKISTKKYLLEIISNINSSYAKSNIKIVSEIDDIVLNFEESLSLGVIINEVVSNSITHNSDLQQNNIVIRLMNLNETIHLRIKDNSKKFFLDNKGLGLNLIEEFIKRLKESNYYYSFEDETVFNLSFKKVINE